MNESWTEAELAYFAGILDGEGSFVLHNPGTHRYGCQVQVGNTDVRLMDWIRQRFGGHIGTERCNSAKWKQIWRWTSKANELDALLAAVVPFLILKRHQAELLQAYRATLAPKAHAGRRADGSGRNTAPTSVTVKDARTRIHAELALLNRRGA